MRTERYWFFVKLLVKFALGACGVECTYINISTGSPFAPAILYTLLSTMPCWRISIDRSVAATHKRPWTRATKLLDHDHNTDQTCYLSVGIAVWFSGAESNINKRIDMPAAWDGRYSSAPRAFFLVAIENVNKFRGAYSRSGEKGPHKMPSPREG